ncbi:MAG: hypothetical protein AAGA03_12625 [Planctomycetota bacterium]
MTGISRLIIVTLAALLLAGPLGLVAHAQPDRVMAANYDFESSGFVQPTGAVSPALYAAGFTGNVMDQPVAPVGFLQGMGGSACDAGCDGACGMGDACGCGPACGCGTSGGCGCGMGSGSSGLAHLCLFCRGGGCSACQSCSPQAMAGLIGLLMPYSEGGLGAQRWYDLSAEATYLGHDARPFGGINGVVATDGINGTPVLRTSDPDAGDDYEFGTRLSAAFIFGPGGNIEATYMGGNEWDSTSTVTSPADITFTSPITINSGATLYSFISDFGVTPGGGFDDTDRSISQSLESSSAFHSGEINYRRRTVGPYQRFQWSWLMGLRYLRFSDSLRYAIIGIDDNAATADDLRFFDANNRVQNNLFGAQLGGDLWWNVVPGVRLGLGAKGAWLQNDVDRSNVYSANSLGPAATRGTLGINDGDRRGTVMAEFEAKSLYRLTYSWTLRSSYYVVAIDDIAAAGIDSTGLQSFANGSALSVGNVQYDSLTISGFTFGAEYLW